MHEISNWPVCLMPLRCNSYWCIWYIMVRIWFLCISFFQPDSTAIAKVRKEKCSGIIFGFPWWYHYWKMSWYFFLEHTDFTIQKTRKTPTLSENETISGLLIRESFGNTNLPREIADVIADSCRTTTQSQYKLVLRWWFIYASSRNTDPYTPDVNTLLSFMHGIYKNGCLCSRLCAACSALSSILTIKGYTKLSEHPFISR